MICDMGNKCGILKCLVLTVGVFVSGAFVSRYVLSSDSGSASCIKTADVKDVISQYLMDNPMDIIRSLETFQLAQIEEEKRSRESAFVRLYDDFRKINIPVVSDNKADVTVLHFFDPLCGYSKVASNVVLALLERKDINLILVPLAIFSDKSKDIVMNLNASYLAGGKDEFLKDYKKVMHSESSGFSNTDLKSEFSEDEKSEVKALYSKIDTFRRELSFNAVPVYVLYSASKKKARINEGALPLNILSAEIDALISKN